jgi:proton glutamate symport protein
MAFRLPRLKLHNKLLLAVVLGAAFGVLFNVSRYELKIAYINSRHEDVEDVVRDWSSIEFSSTAEGVLPVKFGKDDQLGILGYFSGLKRDQKAATVIWVHHVSVDSTGGVHKVNERFGQISRIERVQTIAVAIKPFGTVFVRLLLFIAIPLVVSSLIVGASSLGGLRRVGVIGAKTLFFYVVTIVSAVIIGLALVNFIKPGTRLEPEARENLMTEVQTDMQEKTGQEVDLDPTGMFVRIVSTNPIESMARGDMLQIIFFALMVGVSLTAVAREKAAHVTGFFDGMSDLMIRMVDMIMTVAPFGVFALIAAAVGEFGFGILQTLAWYAGTLLVGFLLHAFVTLAVLVRTLGGMNPLRFFREFKDVMLIAFSSSSSAATLPVNMGTCEQKLGVPREIASFVLPLGATVNMNGTALYQAVATVFIAQVYGVDLNLGAQLTILIASVLASIAAAPVPGSGLLMLIIVLRSVHVPVEGIALILGIDRIVDMCRTVLNVSGDAVVAVIMAKQEGVLRATGRLAV